MHVFGKLYLGRKLGIGAVRHIVDVEPSRLVGIGPVLPILICACGKHPPAIWRSDRMHGLECRARSLVAQQLHCARVLGIADIDHRDSCERRIASGFDQVHWKRPAGARNIGAVIDPRQLDVAVAPANGVMADHAHALVIGPSKNAAGIILRHCLPLQARLEPVSRLRTPDGSASSHQHKRSAKEVPARPH